MLLSLPNFFSEFKATRLAISVGVDGIAIVQSKGFKKTLVHQQFIASTQEADWQLLVQQLDAALIQLKTASNTLCTIVLSSDFVRYLVLPAQPFAMNNLEKMAYVQAAYRNIYGAVTDGWNIKCDNAAPHVNMLAVAVDAQLMAALGQLATQHQLKLDSVQPYLMTAFNALMPQLLGKNGYLVLLEQSKLLLIRLQNGECQHLRTLTFHHDWQLDLQQTIVRESALNEDSITVNKQLFVYAPAKKNTTINKIAGWEIQKIGLKNGLSNPQYSMLEAVL